MHTPEASPRLMQAAGAVSIAAALLMAGGGVAAAESVVGMTYRDAQQAVADMGGTIDVTTTVGTRLNLGNCIVSSAHRATNRDGRGRATAMKMLVDLNCNGVYDGSHPGYSLGSPQGRRQHDIQEANEAQLQAQQEALLAQQQAALEAQQAEAVEEVSGQ